jgi:hypothetical protein
MKKKRRWEYSYWEISDLQRNKKFDKLLINFVNQLNMTAMDEILNKNEAYHTFTGSNGTSWIDHVIVNNVLKQRVIETNIIESPINTSDHFAIEIKLIVKIQKTIMNNKSNRN